MYDPPPSCCIFRNEIGKIWQNFIQHSDQIVTSDKIEATGDLTCSLIVEKNVPSGLVSIDVTLLHLLMNNLLQNSYIYTNNGEISVHISAERKEKHVFTMNIRIKDTGEGIAEKEIENVFGPFYKSSQITSGCGPGMGLPVSREICRFFDGD